MSTTPSSKPRFWQKCFSFWKRYYAPITAGLAITSALTIKYSPTDWALLHGSAATALSLAVIGFLVETSTYMQAFKEELAKFADTCPTQNDLVAVSKRCDELVLNHTIKLHDISECMRQLRLQLSEALQHHHGEMAVEIDHLGLDMQVAHEEVDKLITETPNLNHIRFRFLIMDDEPDAFGFNAPPAVRAWAKDAKDGQEWLNKLKELAEQNSIRGKSVVVDFKEYNELPVFHGIAVRKPFVAYFISHCRWKKSQATGKSSWVWGKNSYRISFGEPQDPQLRDLVDSFNAQFEHLWSADQHPEQPPEEPAPDKPLVVPSQNLPT